MVSFWPWRDNASSTASFEKTLSNLYANITKRQARLEATRNRSRRVKVLWTLYLTFAYLTFVIVSFLVIGSRNLGSYEWGGIIGGPVFIFLVRKAIASAFHYRVETMSARLKQLRKERAETIQKLKDATKYDSTLELIAKYGGEDTPGSKKLNPSSDSNSTSHTKHDTSGNVRRHTRMVPPLTANIVRPEHDTPQESHSSLPFSASSPPQQHQQQQKQQNGVVPGEEFAPDDYAQSLAQPHRTITPAASYSPVHAHAYTPSHYSFSPQYFEPRWYDRIFELLLGEDEKDPRNRIVLLCKTCRLINGQAPPGTTSLAELGTWRCLSCHTLNGELEDDVAARSIAQDSAGAETSVEPESMSDSGESEHEMLEKQGGAEGEGNDEDEAALGKRKGRTKRGTRGGTRKKMAQKAAKEGAEGEA